MKQTLRNNHSIKTPDWKSAIRSLLSPKEQGAAPESRTVELDDITFGICREIAASRQISLKEAVAYMARMYEEERTFQLMLQATDEQLARNPLLALDTLIGRAADQGGSYDERA